MIIHKDVLTTGQVAQICHVAPRTVTKWFDSGQIKGYRIPGSRDRRIPVSELIRFMKSHDIPTEELEKGHIRILLIDSNIEDSRRFAEKLQSKGSFNVEIAGNSFDAGLLAQKLRPNIILVNLMSNEVDAPGLCSYVRENEDLKHCLVIALSGKLSENERDSLLKQGFSEVVTSTDNINDVLVCIQEKCSIFY